MTFLVCADNRHRADCAHCSTNKFRMMVMVLFSTSSLHAILPTRDPISNFLRAGGPHPDSRWRCSEKAVTRWSARVFLSLGFFSGPALFFFLLFSKYLGPEPFAFFRGHIGKKVLRNWVAPLGGQLAQRIFFLTRETTRKCTLDSIRVLCAARN